MLELISDWAFAQRQSPARTPPRALIGGAQPNYGWGALVTLRYIKMAGASGSGHEVRRSRTPHIQTIIRSLGSAGSDGKPAATLTSPPPQSTPTFWCRRHRPRLHRHDREAAASLVVAFEQISIAELEMAGST